MPYVVILIAAGVAARVICGILWEHKYIPSHYEWLDCLLEEQGTDEAELVRVLLRRKRARGAHHHLLSLVARHLRVLLQEGLVTRKTCGRGRILWVLTPAGQARKLVRGKHESALPAVSSIPTRPSWNDAELT